MPSTATLTEPRGKPIQGDCRITAAKPGRHGPLAAHAGLRSALLAARDPGALTNTDLLDVLKASRNNRELLRDGELVGWAAESTTTADRFAALFNTGKEPLEAALPLGDLGLHGKASWEAWSAVEAWSGKGIRPGAAALEAAGLVP